MTSKLNYCPRSRPDARLPTTKIFSSFIFLASYFVSSSCWDYESASHTDVVWREVEGGKKNTSEMGQQRIFINNNSVDGSSTDSGERSTVLSTVASSLYHKEVIWFITPEYTKNASFVNLSKRVGEKIHQ